MSLSEKSDPQPPPPSRDQSSLKGSETFIEQHESPRRASTQNLNAKLANPLAGLSHEQLMADAEEFAKTHELAEYTETIQKGALIAQDPTVFESLPMLTDEDRRFLRREVTHKWDQPKTLYYLVVMCSLAAAVQGVRFSSAMLEGVCSPTFPAADGRVCDQRRESVLSLTVRHPARSGSWRKSGAVVGRSGELSPIRTWRIHAPSFPSLTRPLSCAAVFSAAG